MEKRLWGGRAEDTAAAPTLDGRVRPSVRQLGHVIDSRPHTAPGSGARTCTYVISAKLGINRPEERSFSPHAALVSAAPKSNAATLNDFSAVAAFSSIQCLPCRVTLAAAAAGDLVTSKADSPHARPQAPSARVEERTEGRVDAV